MQFVNYKISLISLISIVAACGGDKVTAPSLATTFSGPPLQVLGHGAELDRYTAEVTVHGTTAYTTTWGTRAAPGNKINIWDVSGAVPVLVDSVLVTGAATIGDIQLSDDSTKMVIATEFAPGSIVIYDLANPRKPAQLARFSTPNTSPGVHTVKLGRVNGKLYAFLSVDPSSLAAARLVIADLSDIAHPREAYARVIGNPYVHDTYFRDGILFLGLWNDGVDIWDLGGAGQGGTPENPKVLGNVKTVGGDVHNIWWYHDPKGGKRFAFVGQEVPVSLGRSAGDIHVIDVSDMTAPKEVAFYSVPNAGTHNFSVDEKHEVLYAAYYNGGVRAIDVHGDLTDCGSARITNSSGLARCDLKLMGREIGTALSDQNVYIWGVAYVGTALYASDMLSGIWKLNPAK